MEGFFALLQQNRFNRHNWTTRDELRSAIVSWIERTFNRRRRERVLGRLTPVGLMANAGVLLISELELVDADLQDVLEWMEALGVVDLGTAQRCAAGQLPGLSVLLGNSASPRTMSAKQTSQPSRSVA